MKKPTLRKLKKQLRATDISVEQKAFIKGIYTKQRNVRIWQWVILILFLGSWELFTQLGIMDSFIFSSPSRVAKSVANLIADGSLFYHTGITLAET